MNSNWKAGDKALCVIAFNGRAELDGEPYPEVPPGLGVTYLVSEVGMGDCGLGLHLAGVPDGGGIWSAYKFRKIVPASERATHTASINLDEVRKDAGLMPHEGFWEGRK